MSGRIPSWVLVDEAIVERFAGRTGTGATYAAATVERCHVSEKNRLVRAADGREVTSSTAVFLDPDVEPVPLESRVTVHGRVTTVIESRDHIKPDLPTPDHVQLMCE